MLSTWSGIIIFTLLKILTVNMHAEHVCHADIRGRGRLEPDVKMSHSYSFKT